MDSIFESWRYFVIPVGATGALRPALLALRPVVPGSPHGEPGGIDWPVEGVRWRKDKKVCLVNAPPGNYPKQLNDAVARFEITYDEAITLLKTPDWIEPESET